MSYLLNPLPSVHGKVAHVLTDEMPACIEVEKGFYEPFSASNRMPLAKFRPILVADNADGP